MDSVDLSQPEEQVAYSTGPFSFKIDNPLMFGEVFHIQQQESHSGTVFPMRITLQQLKYKADNPNWFSISFSEEYAGVPMGDYYDIDYRDSITSK